MNTLDEMQIASLLRARPQWEFDGTRGGQITREFVFADFRQAFGFMTQVALAAETLNHHPEWSNVYNRVRIVLTTHDAGGLSALDGQMAQQVDLLYRRCGPGGTSEQADPILLQGGAFCPYPAPPPPAPSVGAFP